MSRLHRAATLGRPRRARGSLRGDGARGKGRAEGALSGAQVKRTWPEAPLPPGLESVSVSARLQAGEEHPWSLGRELCVHSGLADRLHMVGTSCT